MEKPHQCAYQDCKGGSIWYHGWYERKEGALPFEGGTGVCGPLPIRRFMCCGCGRTFSWRPLFLVFLHRLVALAYQRMLADQSGGDWWEPGAAAIEAVRRRLCQAAASLIVRLESHLQRELSGRVDLPHALDLAHDIAKDQVTSDEEPRYACHILFLAIACTRAHAAYKLTVS
ncbi:MAG: hypothetical protein ACRDX8_11625 [Acidimicrobiales bacterium]